MRTTDRWNVTDDKTYAKVLYKTNYRNALAGRAPVVDALLTGPYRDLQFRGYEDGLQQKGLLKTAAV